MAERILAIPTAALESASHGQGFVVDPAWFEALAEASFVDRPSAEQDETRRQVIPYVLLRGSNGIFSYARTVKAGESRLHNLRSIGVGGHLNPGDLPEGLAALADAPKQTLARAAWRELREETVGLAEGPLSWLGFIYLSDTPVSRVHLGVVFAAELGEPNVRLSDEGAMADACYLSVADLCRDRDQYEGWSRVVIDHLESAE